MTKFLFNCSTNIIGGGVKNSTLFIKFILDHDQPFRWYFAVSQEVFDTLRLLRSNLPISSFLILKSPSRCLDSRRTLSSFVKDKDINFVYTMAGPSYVKFDVPHFMGISNPFLTHASFADIFQFMDFSKHFSSIFPFIPLLLGCSG